MFQELITIQKVVISKQNMLHVITVENNKKQLINFIYIFIKSGLDLYVINTGNI